MKKESGFIKSFRLFGRAFTSTKHEMLVSLEVLVAVTLVLSAPLYWVEHAAQPEVLRSYLDALTWSFMGYIGDPGKFATFTPITLPGRWINVLVAVVKIMIFAVPAGLIANGFRNSIAADKRAKQLDDYRKRLNTAFTRYKPKGMSYRVVPSFQSVISIQAKKGMDTKDIIEAVNAGRHFRLRNLAGSMPKAEQIDRLAVEMFPLNRDYGCLVDRSSSVTVVCPTAVTEAGVGNFSWHLAQFGGFNYVSREVDAHPDEPFSYYNIRPDEEDPYIEAFIKDIRQLKSKWVIICCSSIDKEPKCHFVYGARKGDTSYADPRLTVKDTEIFDRASHAVADAWEPYGVQSFWSDLAGSSSMYLGRHLGETNAFTLRPSYKTHLWHAQSHELALVAAKVLVEILTPEHPFEERPEWKERGWGYLKV